jgi:5-methyltetrahydrofolate--homocysteine methyltransferase
LLDPNLRSDYADEINQEYEQVRREHYASLADRKYLSLEKAREKKLRIDWTSQEIQKPSFLGTKVCFLFAIYC